MSDDLDRLHDVLRPGYVNVEHGEASDAWLVFRSENGAIVLCGNELGIWFETLDAYCARVEVERTEAEQRAIRHAAEAERQRNSPERAVAVSRLRARARRFDPAADTDSTVAE